MSDAAIDDIVALLPPLLQSIDALAFVARHLNPADYAAVLDAVGAPDEALAAARSRLSVWPEKLAHVRARLEAASDEALAGFAGLRAVPGDPDGIRSAFRALRHAPRAQEALYPLAATLPPVSQFFLDPSVRDVSGLIARLDGLAPSENTGVMHGGGEPGARGGFSMYVPEYYTPERRWPLVMAMHGGSGNGRAFLWSWLRDARSFGAIVIAPTASGGTWALMEEDRDTPNLLRILDHVRARWNIDAGRMLLTGMSDGGTFSYVSGLEATSPFTHLAPVSASFHPFLAEAADEQRLRDLPIFVTHGRLDWMFPVQLAQQAEQALSQAGARVTYREIDDLSHTYPREINAELLRWLEATPA
jgi:phospholipase/carboxylesterase